MEHGTGAVSDHPPSCEFRLVRPAASVGYQTHPPARRPASPPGCSIARPPISSPTNHPYHPPLPGAASSPSWRGSFCCRVCFESGEQGILHRLQLSHPTHLSFSHPSNSPRPDLSPPSGFTRTSHQPPHRQIHKNLQEAQSNQNGRQHLCPCRPRAPHALWQRTRWCTRRRLLQRRHLPARHVSKR